MKRRKFSREFKNEALELVIERSVSIAQACRRSYAGKSVTGFEVAVNQTGFTGEVGVGHSAAILAVSSAL